MFGKPPSHIYDSFYMLCYLCKENFLVRSISSNLPSGNYDFPTLRRIWICGQTIDHREFWLGAIVSSWNLPLKTPISSILENFENVMRQSFKGEMRASQNNDFDVSFN